MKYRPNIGHGDFCVKTRKVEQFLNQGHKVKITLMFRGREIHKPQRGQQILDRVVQATEKVGRVQNAPTMNGRDMVMVLTPLQP